MFFLTFRAVSRTKMHLKILEFVHLKLYLDRKLSKFSILTCSIQFEWQTSSSEKIPKQCYWLPNCRKIFGFSAANRILKNCFGIFFQWWRLSFKLDPACQNGNFDNFRFKYRFKLTNSSIFKCILVLKTARKVRKNIEVHLSLVYLQYFAIFILVWSDVWGAYMSLSWLNAVLVACLK